MYTELGRKGEINKEAEDTA